MKTGPDNALRWRIRPSDSTLCIGLPSDKYEYEVVRLVSDFIAEREYNFFYKYEKAMELRHSLPALEQVSKEHGLRVVWNASLQDVSCAFANSKLVILLSHCRNREFLELCGALVPFRDIAAAIPESWAGGISGTACETGEEFQTAIRLVRGLSPRVFSFDVKLDLDRWPLFYAMFFDALAKTSLNFGAFLDMFMEELNMQFGQPS